MDSRQEGWAIWFVGLPGSGKSTLAQGVFDDLTAKGMKPVLLQMDKRRKAYFPEPKYTSEEREQAYALFVDEAVQLVRKGRHVLMDGSAYRIAMRASARERIRWFAEVFVHCELEEAIRRESLRPEGLVIADLYRKALQRKETGKQFEGLGEVIGVDVELEMDDSAEFIIDNTALSREETLRKTLHFLDSWLASA